MRPDDLISSAKAEAAQSPILQMVSAATDTEHVEQSRKLRQCLFDAAFKCSAGDPDYHRDALLELSTEQCSSALCSLVLAVPSLLFGPRCRSVGDYFGRSDEQRESLKRANSGPQAELLANALHGELYRFVQERFLAIYGAPVPKGTHIDTSIEIISFKIVFNFLVLNFLRF